MNARQPVAVADLADEVDAFQFGVGTQDPAVRRELSRVWNAALDAVDQRAAHMRIPLELRERLDDLRKARQE